MRDRFFAITLRVVQLTEPLVRASESERVVVETAIPASRDVRLELRDRRVGLVREIERSAEIEMRTQRIFVKRDGRPPRHRRDGTRRSHRCSASRPSAISPSDSCTRGCRLRTNEVSLICANCASTARARSGRPAMAYTSCEIQVWPVPLRDCSQRMRVSTLRRGARRHAAADCETRRRIATTSIESTSCGLALPAPLASAASCR